MDAVAGFKESAIYNIVAQFGFRILTFVLHALVFRFVGSEILGVVNVRLMLLYSTISFLAREPFRRACLTRTNKNWMQQCCLAWLCPIMCVAVGLILVPVWTYVLYTPNSDRVLYYEPAVLLYFLSIFIETLAEPLFVVGQSLMLHKQKVLIDCISIFVKEVVAAVLIIRFPHWSLMAFAYSMVISSTLYCVLYYMLLPRALGSHEMTLLPDSKQLPRKFSDFFVWPVLSFLKHSVLKQLLTEGERYLMTFFNIFTFSEQGIYDVVNNLGSTIARLVFGPLEASVYLFFTQTVERGSLPRSQDERFGMATKMFNALMKMVILMTLFALTFGVPYSFLALKLYGGDSLALPGSSLLKVYCAYIPFLAGNGITEAFLFAIFTNDEVDRHRHMMAIFCLVFVLSAVILSNVFGSAGLILANCVNMACRICYSAWFIRRFYRGETATPFSGLLPTLNVILCCGITFATMMLSTTLFCCSGFFNTTAHLAVGGVCFTIVAMITYVNEIELVDFLWRSFFAKKLR